MARIYALIIGINNYPLKPLQGCVNDAKAVEDFLKTAYPAEQLLIKRLTDEDPEQPTRENFIKGFEHFATAQPGDTCFFYYSGHGSFSPAPVEFWTDSSGFVQSFVCIDSRLPGGHDLMDKEMSYLIWKTTEERKGIHFVAITDCCHCGTITKAIDSSGITDRMMGSENVPAAAKDYLGYGETINNKNAYEKGNEGGKEIITVRQGDHIHIAASRDNQTSKELEIDGQKRGAFTHSLLKTLATCGGQISYKELTEKTALLVKNLVPDQSPDVNINGNLGAAEKRKIFLGQEFAVSNPKFLVYKDLRSAWCIKAGLAHGVSVGDIVMIDGMGSTTIAETTAPDFSVLMTNDDLRNTDQKQFYATVERQPGKAVKISFGEDISAVVKQVFLDAQQKEALPFIEFTEKETGRFVMHADGDNYYISLPGTMEALMKPLPVASEEAQAFFIERLQLMSKWLQLQELNNPSSQLTAQHYTVEVFRGSASGQFEEIKDRGIVEDVVYTEQDGDWQQPQVKIHLTNHSAIPLWINAAYLGVDYSVNTGYLQKMELGPGKDGWISFIEDGLTKNVLPLQLDDQYTKLGYTNITEYFKLFISTDKIDLDSLEQSGIELPIVHKKSANKGDDRSLGTSGTKGLAKREWITETIGFNIIKPATATTVAEGETALGSISIQAPQGFKAQARISSSAQLAPATSQKGADEEHLLPPHLVNGNSYLAPFDLAAMGTRSGIVTDVLELFDLADPGIISEENPLLIKLPSARSADAETLLPIGYDSETKLYYPLGHTDENGDVVLNRLPQETPVDAAITQKSFFGSIKIYFQKVIGQKIGMDYAYPRLAIATVGENNKAKYDADETKLKTAVAGSKDIILFIHGIIGDTEGMVQCTDNRINGGTETLGHGRLILSFDYENLNTPIEETAADLKKRLHAIGLKEGHGKNLVIIAHSMGGLVSRYYIEKLEGHKDVQQLIMLGTPNNGTPWADVRDLAETLLTYALNGAAFLKPWMLLLSVVGRFTKGTQVCMKQMDAKTGIYNTLNKDAATEMPYTILVGNTQKIMVNHEATENLLQRVFKTVKQRGAYAALDTLLFKKPNDIAVTDESIQTLTTCSGWKKSPAVHEVPCDHMNYFTNPVSLGIIHAQLNQN
ncbi:MAG: caspase [Ferruginibacter sp.]|nr:caspase [Ferruginibacter sp.]